MGYDSFPESAEVPQQWLGWETVEHGDMIPISKSRGTKPVSVDMASTQLEASE